MSKNDPAFSTGLKLTPHTVRRSPGVWWYEIPNGMEIHVENTAIDPRTGQAVFVIGWSVVQRALQRLSMEQR